MWCLPLAFCARMVAPTYSRQLLETMEITGSQGIHGIQRYPEIMEIHEQPILFYQNWYAIPHLVISRNQLIVSASRSPPGSEKTCLLELFSAIGGRGHFGIIFEAIFNHGKNFGSPEAPFIIPKSCFGHKTCPKRCHPRNRLIC